MATPTPKATPKPKVTPVTTPTKPAGLATDTKTQANSSLGGLAASLGIDLSKMPAAGSGTSTPKAAPKSGIYIATSTSSNMPAKTSLQDSINTVFQKYYGRDANQSELDTWLPELQKQYVSKSGKTQSTIKYTYKNGTLLNTEYLTADATDPKIWLDNQLKNKLTSGTQDINTLGIPEGPSGKYFVALKNLAANNGIMLSDGAATSYANSIIAGKLDPNTAYDTIRESAANAFPSMADKIKAGIDLKTLADPYIQSMSNILEVPNTSIDLFDPKIRSAMSFTLPDGKVGTKSIYDFEKELRQDPRWQYTNNARSQAADVATTVLKDFGFRG
jgi:hypothetical protein